MERSTLVEFEIRSLEGVVARLSKDVGLLRTTPPHRDIVEEVARDVLGYARPGDVIFRISSPRP